MTKKSLLIILVLAIVLNIVLGVAYALGEEEDPLVTLSYVEMKIEEVKAYIDGKVAGIGSGTGAAAIFVPVNVNVGQKLICGAGTELILRTGTAKAVSLNENGLVDATGAIDVTNGKEITKQHLIIIPRDDGRGIAIYGTGAAVVMVKGSYKIQ